MLLVLSEIFQDEKSYLLHKRGSKRRIVKPDQSCDTHPLVFLVNDVFRESRIYIQRKSCIRCKKNPAKKMEKSVSWICHLTESNVDPSDRMNGAPFVSRSLNCRNKEDYNENDVWLDFVCPICACSPKTWLLFL